MTDLTEYESQRADRVLRYLPLLRELETELPKWSGDDRSVFEWVMTLSHATGEALRMAWHLTTAGEGRPTAFRAAQLRRQLLHVALIAVQATEAVDRRHGETIREYEHLHE